LGDREGAGDNGLTGDNGGKGRKDQQGPVDKLWHHVPEGIVHGGRIGQQEGALTQIVQRQTG